MSRVMWAALLVVGCGHPAPAPRPPGTDHVTAPAPDAGPPPAPVPLDRDLPRLAERGSKLLADLAAAFTAVGEDCPAAIARLGALKATYGDVIAANAQVLHDGRAKELKAALAPYEDGNAASAKAIVQSKTMVTCSQDRAFTQAFDDLVAPP